MANKTRIEAEKILHKSLNKIAKEQNYDDPEIKITPVSTEGANYTSFLYHATISSKENHLNLFAKVAAVGETLRSQGATHVFKLEELFYSELAVRYRELEEKHKVSKEYRFIPPKIYDINTELQGETFVMENLVARGYGLHDRFKSVDWNYATAAFTEAAKMHALSMALSHERPDEFKNYAKECKFMFDMESGNTLDIQQVMEQGMHQTLVVTREEFKGRLMAFLGKFMAEGGLQNFVKFYTPGDFPVIRHGDFRPSNMMHKLKEDGSTDTVVVDFQTLLAGNPVIDLYYFIFLGTDKNFRDKYYDKLIEHYYSELSASLERLGLNPEKTYSRTKFNDDMKEHQVYGLIVALTTLALVTVDSAEAPEVTGEQDISSLMNLKLSSVFEDRLNGILEDFVKWGIL